MKNTINIWNMIAIRVDSLLRKNPLPLLSNISHAKPWFSIGSSYSWLGSSSLSYDPPPLGSSMTSPVSMTSPPRRKPLWTPPTLSAGERPHGRARNLATKCGAASLYMAYLRHGPPARNSPVSAIRFRFICIKHAQSRPNGQINSRTLDEGEMLQRKSYMFGSPKPWVPLKILEIGSFQSQKMPGLGSSWFQWSPNEYDGVHIGLRAT